jgi:hypothetical protein
MSNNFDSARILLAKLGLNGSGARITVFFQPGSNSLS